MYNFPKDPAMRRRWMSRINRTSDNLVPNKHKVCSEHFAEEDFDPGDLLAFRMMSEKYPNSRIRLKDDAVPNTDRGTDGFVLRPETTPSEDSQPGPSRRQERHSKPSLILSPAQE